MKKLLFILVAGLMVLGEIQHVSAQVLGQGQMSAISRSNTFGFTTNVFVACPAEKNVVTRYVYNTNTTVVLILSPRRDVGTLTGSGALWTVPVSSTFCLGCYSNPVYNGTIYGMWTNVGLASTITQGVPSVDIKLN